MRVKGLSRLNCGLSRVVVVDHDSRVLGLQPNNAVLVPERSGDPANTVLLDFIPMLEGLVRKDVADVREAFLIMRDKPIAEGVTA